MIEREIRSAVITGPTGAVGTALCRELAEKQIRVYAVCRPGSPRAAHLPRSEWIRPIFCDMGELEQLPILLPDGADAFFHLAWAHTIGPGRNDMPAQIDNIRDAVCAVQAAAALGCRVFVGVGSQAEYGRVDGILKPETPCFPENGYGMAKLCAGQMTRVECKKRGIAHVWVRILSAYGPGDGPDTMVSSVARSLLEKKKPALTAGAQEWDYLYAGDAACALRLAALHGRDGAVYPLGSGRVRPLREYVEMLRDAVDPALPLGFGEIPYGPLQVMHLQADISALQRDTGFAPATDFEAGIRNTIAWMRENQ
jgi:UDP-glucose 4-epimerase